jgi:hypothetical protein
MASALIVAYPLPVRVNMRRVGMALVITEIVGLGFLSPRIVASKVCVSTLIPRSRILGRSVLWNKAAADPATLLLMLLATGLRAGALVPAAVLLVVVGLSAASVLVLAKRRKADRQ